VRERLGEERERETAAAGGRGVRRVLGEERERETGARVVALGVRLGMRGAWCAAKRGRRG
jgi:hypothetical protein